MSFFPQTTPALYKHQSEDLKFYLDREAVFNTADPGTGKTRTILEVLRQRAPTERGRVLILCPKSITQAAWGNDIKRFTPNLTYSIAAAENRVAAFEEPTDIVISNHDAVKDILNKIPKNRLEAFNTLIIDESTAFKNPTAVRSKKVAELSQQMQYKSCLTGTPTPNGILDLWHQVYLLDRGVRLGESYYRFRMAVCDPQPVPGHAGVCKWIGKPGIETIVGQLIQDITIRRTLEDCLDLPEQVINTVYYDPPPKVQEAYAVLKREALLRISEERNVTAIHAAAELTKLLQVLSGAVYDNESYSLIDTKRYELLLDLAEARQHSLCTFNWKHQKALLSEGAKKRGLSHAIIDGSTPGPERTRIVDAFQRGEFRVLFAHPQSAGHGLTLTKGTSIIWSSPTYNLEHYLQFNRRIYRAGQTQKTEVVLIHAPNTIEDKVYARLNQKQQLQLNLLELLQ